jgi:hypothetical protein
LGIGYRFPEQLIRPLLFNTQFYFAHVGVFGYHSCISISLLYEFLPTLPLRLSIMSLFFTRAIVQYKHLTCRAQCILRSSSVDYL